MQSKKSPPSLALLLSASLIMAGCQAMNHSSSELSPASQNDIRTAATDFTHAFRQNDVASLGHVTFVGENPPCKDIESAVFADMVTSRKVQLTLSKKFGYQEENPAVIGSSAWIDQYAAVARSSPIQRTGDRAHIGEAGKAGGFFLCDVDGVWKVELIATFVTEARGRQELADSAVLYRYGVDQAASQWLLSRLNNDEFSSLRDYDKAEDRFWIDYLSCTLGGKDPHNELLSSLPPLPPNAQLAADR